MNHPTPEHAQSPEELEHLTTNLVGQRARVRTDQEGPVLMDITSNTGGVLSGTRLDTGEQYSVHVLATGTTEIMERV